MTGVKFLLETSSSITWIVAKKKLCTLNSKQFYSIAAYNWMKNSKWAFKLSSTHWCNFKTSCFNFHTTLVKNSYKQQLEEKIEFVTNEEVSWSINSCANFVLACLSYSPHENLSQSFLKRIGFLHIWLEIQKKCFTFSCTILGGG